MGRLAVPLALFERRHSDRPTLTAMLRDLLYEENSFGVFLMVTVVLGGGAAWLAGRAVAIAWTLRTCSSRPTTRSLTAR